MPVDIDNFLRQVRQNCAISDAQYWGYFSVCGLLLRMRELYLGEKGLVPWQSPPHREIADWISIQEQRWQDLESSSLIEMELNGSSFSPFDTEGINTQLKGSGLLYGAGYGIFSKPVFFVGKLAGWREILDYEVRFVSDEVCRDLSIHPAMLQGRCIFIRLDAVRSVLWERFQALSSRLCKGHAFESFAQYGLFSTQTGSQEFLSSLDRMISDASEIFLFHEVGEAFEDDRADEWAGMLVSIEDRYAELYLRGIKDVIADTSVQGPIATFLRRREHGLLTLYAGLLDGIRKDLFTEASLQDFFSGEWQKVEEARASAYLRLTSSKNSILESWRSSRSPQAVAAIVRSLYPAGRINR